ncbi:type VI secretion system protein VasD [Pseudomonas nitritireducens]|uniref:Type VI secretion system protein VasD n=1 Tax=Pseudomonas nitroreducens TaxID=46680 RepID=A0A7W7P4R4_PSENT|nr:type VI secretion system lipoprotein TssJ [Pseudomonas nitritireducens]MBB4866930.1 type VI secretion system protein VasD [Pseudomonas nitritireducens]
MPALRSIALLALVVLTSACSALSPYSKITKLELSLSASDQLNPDLDGRPSPIVVRLIELKSPVAFENADFFSLYDRSREALAPDLVASEEIEMRPGETRELKLTVNDGSRYVGVLAAYRDLPETRWRYVVTLAPVQLNRADLRLDQTGIQALADASQAKGN